MPYHRWPGTAGTEPIADPVATCYPPYVWRTPTDEQPAPLEVEPLIAGVTLRLPDGREEFATHGAIIGRLVSSAVHIDDAAISEAHALISLRAGGFRLLALRGRLAVASHQVKDLALVPGTEVYLTPRHRLHVIDVFLPRAVLAIEGPGLLRQALAATNSIVTQPRLQVLPLFREDAAAWIWSNGAEWNLRTTIEDTPRPLRDGQRFTVDGIELVTTRLPLTDAGGAQTIDSAPELQPLTIEARYDVVQIRRGGLPTATLSGKTANLVSELVMLGGTAKWEVLAGELWRGADREVLRRNFDVVMVRLRQKLRESGVRPDLVRSLGTGVVELVLHTSDQVVDAC